MLRHLPNCAGFHSLATLERASLGARPTFLRDRAIFDRVRSTLGRNNANLRRGRPKISRARAKCDRHRATFCRTRAEHGRHGPERWRNSTSLKCSSAPRGFRATCASPARSCSCSATTGSTPLLADLEKFGPRSRAHPDPPSVEPGPNSVETGRQIAPLLRHWLCLEGLLCRGWGGRSRRTGHQGSSRGVAKSPPP